MTESKKERYRLDLDLGTNSIGWAAVILDDKGDPCGVLDMGVRIFPDGRDAQSKTSNAAARRIARGQRRRRDRYLQRRRDLLEALVKLGLMPQDETERRELVQRLHDPYVLRAKALDHPLEPFELGRAIFHLNQRRGFKSNRKAAGDESEKTKISDRIDELRRQMQVAEVRTLGEFLARRHEKRETVRARPELGLYPDRAMYQEEFDAVRKAQEAHHTLTGEQWGRLQGIIFCQRPLKPVKPGWCQFEYEHEERRAAKALPVFQEFRILQEVNNLKVRVGTEPERPLNPQERERVLKRLRSGNGIDLEKPTKNLGLPPGTVVNLAAGGRKSIKGDETTARLASSGQPATAKRAVRPGLFGPRWLDLSLEKRNDIVRFLLETAEPEDIRQKAKDEWGLDKAQAKAVSEVSLVAGYGNLSEKAISKIMPHLEKGMRYDEAVKEVYEHHSDFRNEEAHDFLPYYGIVLPRDAVGADPKKDPENEGEAARYGRFPNPTVHIGLNQLRRVVNRLIEAHGKPEDIVVELTRDLKMNWEQKRENERRQRKGRQDNERFRKWLEDAEVHDITADMLRKLRLWEEQGPPHARVCPYTGKILTFEMVTSSQTEIDHILPFSKTLDNSSANMVVCIASSNRLKGDRSPHEAFGHSSDGYDYQDILDRVANFQTPANKKLWRFQQDAMKEFEKQRDFLDRQLNETSYLSRTARTYLSYLYDEKGEGRQRVRAAPGRMTALLRQGWGLEGMLRASPQGEILRKQRDDHRHHAIDAFVIACTTQGLLQEFARASASNVNPEERLEAVANKTKPWNDFHRNQVKPFIDKIIISYKPDHGRRGVKGQTTGQLHNETAYGLVEYSEDGPSTVVVRKKVADFKKREDLQAVRDETMRKALLALWDKVSAATSESKEIPARFAEQAAQDGVRIKGRLQSVPVRHVRVLDEQSIIPIRDRNGKLYKGYLPGGNEFAEVWSMPDGSWRTVVVSKFDSNQPGFNLNDFRPHPVAKRIMRLHIDDMGALGDGPNLRIVRVRQMDNNKTGPRLVLDSHNEANVDARIRQDAKTRRDTGIDGGMKVEVFSASKLRRLGFRKVSVDEIGRVRDPGPRKP